MGQGRVLFFESRSEFRATGRALLRDRGFLVRAARDLKEGLFYLIREPISLILYDVELEDAPLLWPVVARQYGHIPRILTVLRNSNTEAEIDVRTRWARDATGVELGTLYKPFDAEALLPLVERAFGAEGIKIERPRLQLVDLYDVRDQKAAIEKSEPAKETKAAAASTPSASVTSPGRSTETDARVSKSPRYKIAAEGEIQHIPIEQLLQLAATMEGAVLCELQGPQNGQSAPRYSLYMRGQDVVFATASRMAESLRIGRMLVTLGVLPQEVLGRVLGETAPSSRWLGRRLLMRGLLVPPELEQALVRQVEEVFYEALRLTSGRFRLIVEAELPREGEAAKLSVPLQQLLMEGVRRLDDWARWDEEAFGLDSIVARVDSTLGPEEAPLSGADARILAELGDGLSIRELIRRLKRPAFDVFSIVYKLMQSDRVVARSSSSQIFSGTG